MKSSQYCNISLVDNSLSKAWFYLFRLSLSKNWKPSSALMKLITYFSLFIFQKKPVRARTWVVNFESNGREVTFCP